jgi:hypothetical protein
MVCVSYAENKTLTWKAGVGFCIHVYFKLIYHSTAEFFRRLRIGYGRPEFRKRTERHEISRVFQQYVHDMYLRTGSESSAHPFIVYRSNMLGRFVLFGLNLTFVFWGCIVAHVLGFKWTVRFGHDYLRNTHTRCSHILYWENPCIGKSRIESNRRQNPKSLTGG